MTALVVAVIVVLGVFCVVLYLSQERRQRAHDQAMGQLIRQITSSNPANSTLKAMKQTAEVLTDAVDKVTGTIGASFATATGVGENKVVTPDEQQSDDGPYIPDVDLDGLFAPTLGPYVDNGMISPAPQQETA